MSLNDLTYINDSFDTILDNVNILKKVFNENLILQNNFFSLLEDICLCDTNYAKLQNKQVKKLYFVGIGKSGIISQLISSFLNSVSIMSYFLHPSEAIHGDLGKINSNDVIVCLSNQGNSKEILDILPNLKERGVIIYGITFNSNSSLAKQSDYILNLEQINELSTIGQIPLINSLLNLIVGELLVKISVDKRGFSIKQFANNHPGGNIGKQIYIKVKDIMIQINDLPIIESKLSFADCISFITKYGKGVLFIVENSNALNSDYKLVGIIAEKDIRTAMEKYDKNIFTKTAVDIMNTKPYTVDCDMLAIQALKIMKTHKNMLNFVPVLNNDKLVGLLRLHELINAGITIIE